MVQYFNPARFPQIIPILYIFLHFPPNDRIQCQYNILIENTCLVIIFFVAVIPELCENDNDGCEHFCSVNQRSTECSCADGYILASDLKSCTPTGEKDSRVYMVQAVQTLGMNHSVDNILSKNREVTNLKELCGLTGQKFLHKKNEKLVLPHSTLLTVFLLEM